MGTPEFAIPSLNLLKLSEHRLVALVSQPDRPAGRGKKIRLNPVKQWAEKSNLEIFQPFDFSGQTFISWLEEKRPDLIITVAFGRILPPRILELPDLGCINLHASYLPEYRGAAPIHRAVIDGAPYSGVTIIFMSSELDAGDIIMQEKEEISYYDTAGMLHDRLANRGASLLMKSVDALASGTAKPVPQDHSMATYAEPLQPMDEELDWRKRAAELYNRIRGLNPYPGAYTSYQGKRIKVWRAAPPERELMQGKQAEPGTVIAVGDDSLKVAVGDGTLDLLDLQPAGKKKMDAGSFCCGYRIRPGDMLDGVSESEK